MARPPRFPTFLAEKVQPPSTWPIFLEEDIVLRVWNSVSGITLYVEGRVLTPTGEIKVIREELTPTANRVVNTLVIPPALGYFLGLTVYPDTDLKRGQCFASATTRHLGRNTLVLFSDYLTEANVGIGWPGGRQIKPREGPGVIRYITGTDPSAGSYISEYPPTNAFWRLRSIRFQFVTDATVADRQVFMIIYGTGGYDIFHTAPLPAQGASLTRYYVFAARDMADDTAFDGRNWIRGYFPESVSLLPDTFFIRVMAVNMKSGDDFGFVRLTVEEWIEE